MKEEKNHSGKGEKSVSLSTIAASFAAGAAAGLAVGFLISSEKGASFRDKIKSFLKEADGSTNFSDLSTADGPSMMEETDEQRPGQRFDEPSS